MRGKSVAFSICEMSVQQVMDDEEQQQLVEEVLRQAAAGENRPARSLVKDVVCASLSGLGHNEKGHVVYTTLNLTSLSLGDIAILQSYPFLQRVHLDGNQLTSLSPLREAASLIHVSASHNKLKDDVFDAFVSSAKSLESLDLSFNQITSCSSGVRKYSFLQELRLAHNCITTIRKGDVDGMKSLRVVDVSNNQLTSIDTDAFASTPVTHLNVSLNELTEISFVLPVAATLTWVDASDNNMMHFEEVQKLSKLTTLLLAGNNTYDNSEILNLAKLPMLRELSLIGNPLCNLSHGINEPLDDDAGSDVVAADEAEKSGGASTGARRKAKQAHAPAASETQARPAVGAATNTDKTPDEEDAEEFAGLSLEQQYRLTILWRVPIITVLDGKAVTPQEVTLANNLQGGADRDKRSAARTKYLTAAAGSATNAIRMSRQ